MGQRGGDSTGFPCRRAARPPQKYDTYGGKNRTARDKTPASGFLPPLASPKRTATTSTVSAAPQPPPVRPGPDASLPQQPILLAARLGPAPVTSKATQPLTLPRQLTEVNLANRPGPINEESSLYRRIFISAKRACVLTSPAPLWPAR